MSDVLAESRSPAAEGQPPNDPALQLRTQLTDELDLIYAASGKSYVYLNSHAVDQSFGAEYGDRTLLELIQNAHDAHAKDDAGEIAVHLATDGGESALYVANRGHGFSWGNVQAIRNVAMSSKNAGEGIGNKGLGFRSVESLTTDPRIYSQERAEIKDRFDGFCFRLLAPIEVSAELRARGLDATASEIAAGGISRYLMAAPVEDQPADVRRYAQEGFATVIVLPLRSVSARTRAHEQVRALLDADVPLLLFLDRLEKVTISITDARGTSRRDLRRRAGRAEFLPGCAGTTLRRVDLGEQGAFAVARVELERSLLLRAVENSIERAHVLRNWMNWVGDASVAIALPLDGAAVRGRLYNFLPMGTEAASPMRAHLDAPFFAQVNRTDADLTLPLNEFLLEAAADLSAGLALAASSERTPASLPAHAGLNVAMWSVSHLSLLQQAFERRNVRLSEAAIVPVIAPRGERRWSSFGAVVRWPDRGMAILTPARVAAVCGAPILLREFHTEMVEEIEAFAKRLGRWSLLPSESDLGDWLERFAAYLLNEGGKAGPLRWRSFYDDIPKLYPSHSRLKSLAGRRIFLERKRRLGLADPGKGGPLFVRSGGTRKRHRTARFPPSSLLRRMRMLDESIALDEATLSAFVAADLLRPYDPIAALKEIRATLAGAAGEALLNDVLTWAYEVWRDDRDAAQGPLATSGLRVPTRTRWTPAKAATFSASWTEQGAVLESFLDEVSGASEDCHEVRDCLLIAFDDWPCRVPAATKKSWHEFLEILGVQDGLRPLDSSVVRKDAYASTWEQIFRYGRSIDGLDKTWLLETKPLALYHPNSVYGRRGRIARLPGQVEFVGFSETAKDRFYRLSLAYLRHHGDADFTFRIGRYTRLSGIEDEHRDLPTPLAAFVRNMPWMRFEMSGEVRFLQPSAGWGSGHKGRQPPRFMAHLEQAVAEEVAHDVALATILFSPRVGLRDWYSPQLAIERLRELAKVFADLPNHDRTVFRKEYARAWREAADEQLSLTTDLAVVVHHSGAEVVAEPAEDSPQLLIARDDEGLRIRMLSDAGFSVLPVPPEATIWALESLQNVGRNVARAEDVDVALMVDGRVFTPDPFDPLLVDQDLIWLTSVLRIAHETMAGGLERGNLPIEPVETRLRNLRVRFCADWQIAVEGYHMGPAGRRIVYGFEHSEYPTLIVPRSRFDWTVLLSATTEIRKLLDSRLESFEMCMLQLRLLYDDLRAPTDEELSIATNTDVTTVRAYQSELHDAFTLVRHAFAAIVSYYHGREMGFQLRDAERVQNRAQLRELLSASGAWDAMLDEALPLVELGYTSPQLQETLSLEFGRYNSALKELGLASLNSEEALREQFAAYCADMRSEILAAIRDAHLEDYASGLSLDGYRDRKTLAFVSFNDEWLNTRPVLDRDVVVEHVRNELSRELGTRSAASGLPDVAATVEANRRVVRSVQSRLATLVGTWAEAHGKPAPVWTTSTPYNIVPLLEEAGLLDFQVLSEVGIPALLARAGAWPDEMPRTTDLAQLGLTVADLDRRNAELARQQEAKRRRERSIVFAGSSLDTESPEFLTQLLSLAEASFRSDCFVSTKITKLAAIEPSLPRRDGSAGGARAYQGGRRVSDGEKTAMGLASEWLAYRWLQTRHKGFVNEAAWVSSNGRKAVGGTPNDDTAGYDFRVADASGTIWMYEVKSSLDNSREFEFTPTEMKAATEFRSDGRRRYRILYVPYVFNPERWTVHELPNPMSEKFRDRYRVIGRALRMQFEFAE